MSTLANIETQVRIVGGVVSIKIAGGAEIRFPVAENARLAQATADQLQGFELSPFGIHWPELDEDLSFAGLLAGDWGQPREAVSNS